MSRIAVASTVLLICVACNADRPPRASCEPQCLVGLDTIIRLSFDTLYAPDASLTIALGAERIAVSTAEAAKELYVFDRAGQLLEIVGRAGGGPGEFNRITGLLYDAVDTLFVIDTGHRRVTVYDPSHQIVREFPAPPVRTVRHLTWADDTTLLVQAMSRQPEWIGFAAHLMSKRGGSVPVIESREPVDTRESVFDERPTARRRAGGIWLGQVRSLAVTYYDQRGDSVSAFTVPHEWSTVPPRNAELYDGIADTEPALRAITEDSAGRLWMLSTESEDPLPRVRIDESFQLTDDFVRRFADYTIHVVEPATGTVLAQERYDLLKLKFLDGGFGYLEDDERSQIVVVRLRLREPDVHSPGDASLQ